MKKVVLLFLVMLTCLAVPAQKKTSSAQQRRQTTTQKAQPKKQTTTTKKSTPGKKATATKKDAASTRKTPVTVSQLKAEKQRVEQERKKSMKRNEELKRNVKKGVEDLMILDTEIARQRVTIDTIRHGIVALDGHIANLNEQLEILEKELNERKSHYMQSMRYMHRNRSAQNQLAFILSADNFNQMYRRMRFNREYAAYQKAQGEAVMARQEQIRLKRMELDSTKNDRHALLVKEEHERQQLENKQTAQQAQVNKLKKEQKTVEALIIEQQKNEAALNERIDKLIAEEIAREKARQEALARKRAEEAAAKKLAEELARKKAAAEAARKENERRIAEAKAREEQARREAKEAARRSTREKELAEQRVKQAEKERKEAEQRADAESRAHKKEIAAVRNAEREKFVNPVEDTKLNGSFEANQGRLPLPISGAYRLVRGYGPYSPEGLSHVKLQSNGWYLKGTAGAKAQCIFNGVVSGVYYQGGSHIVTVRHGKYISVYINLASVSVRKGQNVSTRQVLGTLGPDCTMQFQLRNWSTLLNPSRWIGR